MNMIPSFVPQGEKSSQALHLKVYPLQQIYQEYQDILSFVDEDSEEFDEIIEYCDHIVFNSFAQWNKFKDKIKNSGKNINCGIRINPEYETIDLTKYESRYPKENIGWRGNEFRQEYSFLIKEKYCQHGDLIIDKGVFCGKVNLLDHVDEHGKQEISLLLYGSPTLIGHVEQDGTVYEVYAWR